MRDQPPRPARRTSNTQADPPGQTGPRTRRRRPSRRVRLLIWAGLLIPGLAVGAALVATQTPVTRWIVLPRLRDALGLDLRAAGVRVSAAGHLVLDGVTCRVPGVEGPGGQVLSARRLVVDVGWGRASGPAVRSIRLLGGVVRLSESVQTGEINVSGIPLSTGVGPTQLPAIEPTDVLVELGEHTPDRFTATKTVHLRATLGLAPDSASYFVSLREVADAEGGLELRGVTGEGGTELELTGLSLDSWALRSFPRGVREFAPELALEGEVRSAVFSAGDQDFRLDVQLAGVAMNLPWLSEGPGEGAMRLRGVSGLLRFLPQGVSASLSGSLEDLPCRVRLDYEGFDEHAPFRGRIECPEYRVGEDPVLLPYLPAKVQRRFHEFSGPEAVVSATVNVWRTAEEAGRPGEIDYEGRAQFRDGVASFHKFPYEFRDLHGQVRFDSRAVTIERVEGRADTGAELSATGLIAPPDGSGEVEVLVDVRRVPVDEALAAGMGEARAPILDAVFSRPHYERLLERGLVSAQPGPPGSPPHFPLGGPGTVAIAVRHGAEPEDGWTTHVKAHFPLLGVLPREFPYPMVGRDVTIAIDDERAHVEDALLEGLEGGHARVRADVTLTTAGGGPGVRPELRLSVKGVPVSPLFLSAIPDADLIGGDGRGVTDMLADLRVRGLLEGLVTVAPREGGKVGFDARVAFPALTMEPLPGRADGPALEARVRGSARINEANLHAECEGEVLALPPGAGERPTPAAARGVRVGIDAPLRRDAGVRVAAALAGADLGAPLEDIVRAVHPGAGERLAALRSAYRPEGVADVSVSVDATPAATSVSASLLEARTLSFEALGGRVTVEGFSGAASAHVADHSAPTVLRFENAAAQVAFDGEPSGTATLSGQVVLDGEGGLAPASAAEGTLAQARLESGLTRAVLRLAAAGKVRERWEKARPAGEYSARFSLGGGEAAPGASGPRYAVEVEPRSLAWTSRGERIVAGTVQGTVKLTPGAGRVDGLEAQGQGWSLRGSGEWESAPGDGLSAVARFDLEADRLTPQVAVMVPAGIADALDQVGLGLDGPFSLRDAVVRGRLDENGGPTGSFTGELALTGGSLNPGVEIREASGTASIAATRAAGDAAPWYSISLDLETARVAGLRIGSATAEVEGAPDGVVTVSAASAECHGGRIVADARLEGGLGGSVRTYWADLSLADVRFGPVLTDLSPGEGGSGGEPEAGSDGGELDESRGALNAGLTLSGVVGETGTRRGRGYATVFGERANVLRLPLVLPLIEASNLALPVASRLDYARGDFFIDGSTVAFTDLSVGSEAVWIRGYGTMTWPDQRLDLRFNSGSARRIPVISVLMEGVRNEIISTSVTGTLADPRVALTQFTGTRRFLRDALGVRPSQRQKRMGELADTPAGPRRAALDTIPPSPAPAVLGGADLAGAGPDGPRDDALNARPPQEDP